MDKDFVIEIKLAVEKFNQAIQQLEAKIQTMVGKLQSTLDKIASKLDALLRKTQSGAAKTAKSVDDIGKSAGVAGDKFDKMGSALAKIGQTGFGGLPAQINRAVAGVDQLNAKMREFLKALQYAAEMYKRINNVLPGSSKQLTGGFGGSGGGSQKLLTGGFDSPAMGQLTGGFSGKQNFQGWSNFVNILKQVGSGLSGIQIKLPSLTSGLSAVGSAASKAFSLGLSALKPFKDLLDTIGRSLIYSTIYGAFNQVTSSIGNATEAVKAFYAESINRASEYQQTIIGFASSLENTVGYKRVGKGTEENFANNVALGKFILDQLRIDSDVNLGTQEDYMQLGGQIVNQVLTSRDFQGKGVTEATKSFRELVSGAVSYAELKKAELPGGVSSLVVSLQQALQGKLRSTSTLVRSGLLTAEEGNKAADEGKIVELLNNRLGGFKQGSKVASRTFDGLKSTLESQGQRVLENLGSGGVQVLTEAMGKLVDMIITVDSEGLPKITNFGQTVMDTFTQIGNVIAGVIQDLIASASDFIANNGPTLMSLAGNLLSVFVQIGTEVAKFLGTFKLQPLIDAMSEFGIRVLYAGYSLNEQLIKPLMEGGGNQAISDLGNGISALVTNLNTVLGPIAAFVKFLQDAWTAAEGLGKVLAGGVGKFVAVNMGVADGGVSEESSRKYKAADAIISEGQAQMSGAFTKKTQPFNFPKPSQSFEEFKNSVGGIFTNKDAVVQKAIDASTRNPLFQTASMPQGSFLRTKKDDLESKDRYSSAASLEASVEETIRKTGYIPNAQISDVKEQRNSRGVDYTVKITGIEDVEEVTLTTNNLNEIENLKRYFNRLQEKVNNMNERRRAAGSLFPSTVGAQ